MEVKIPHAQKTKKKSDFNCILCFTKIGTSEKKKQAAEMYSWLLPDKGAPNYPLKNLFVIEQAIGRAKGTDMSGDSLAQKPGWRFRNTSQHPALVHSVPVQVFSRN